MSFDEKGLEKISKIGTEIKKSFQKGLKLGSMDIKTHDKFGFLENPFERTHISKMDPQWIEELIVYTRYMTDLPKLIGVCFELNRSVEREKNLLVIGPEDVGKTTIAQLIACSGKEILHPDFQEKPEDFCIYVDCEDWTKWFRDGYNEKTGEIEGKFGFYKWIEQIDFTFTRILLLDNLEKISDRLSEFLETIFHALEDPFMIFALVNPIWSDLQEVMDYFDEIYKMNPLNFEIIEEILKRRIIKSKEKNRKEDLTPFSEKAIKEIAEKTLGIPGLAIDFANSCLKSCIAEGHEIINVELINGISKRNKYDLATKIANDFSLGSKWITVLEELVAHSNGTRENPNKLGVTPTILSKNLGLKPSTISYYLSNLNEKGLLSRKTEGRNYYYSIEKPIRNALEIVLPTK